MVKKGQLTWNNRNDVRDNAKEIIRLYKDELISPNKIGEKYNCGEALIVSILKENKAFTILSERRKILSRAGRFKSWCKGLTKYSDERIKKYSDERRSIIWDKNKEIIKMYNEDLLSSKQIAKFYGCSSDTIYAILKENEAIMGCSKRKKLLYSKGKLITWNKNLTKETDERIKPLSNKHKTKLSGIRKRLYSEGKMKIWNKGLTKETDERLKIMGENSKRKDIEEKKLGIVNLYNQGNSMAKIADLFNCSGEVIKRILQENNLNIRSIPFYNKGRISEKKGKTFEQLYGNEKSDKIKEKHSLSCIGEKNHQWQGGKSFEPYSKEFNNILKKQTRERDNNQCQECGKTEIELSSEKLNNNKYLRAHHIDYDKKNNSPLNLVLLCNKCHTKTNFNRKHWENYFKMKIFIKELFNPQNILIFNENKQLIGVERVA